MKSATIHYFSGTGNTYRASAIIKRQLEANGYAVTLKPIENCGDVPSSDDVALKPVGNGSAASSSNVDIFAFPVYAYDVPEIMLKYLRRLPAVKQKKAAVVAVHGMLWQKPRVPGDGDDPGYSFEHARWILARKGYDVAYTMAVGYPHSISMLASTPPAGEQALIRPASDKRVEEFGNKVAREERSLQKCGIIPVIYSIVPGFVYGLFGRRGLGKLFVADTGCTKCGKCVKSCPSHAIRFSLGRPRWDWKCQGCQRCINTCPQRAIQASLFRIAIMFGGLFVPWNAAAYALMPIGLFSTHAGLIGTILDLAVWLAIYAVVMYVLEKVLFVLEAVPIIGKAMSLNLSSPNRRYLDPIYRQAMAEKPVEAVEARSR